MKRVILIFAVVFLSFNIASSQTRVIAHRGYWNCEGSAQNSIAALRNSAKIGVFGSEFDVLMTKDGVLVVNHDNTINNIDIQNVDYKEIKHLKIANGEQLPTLEEYLVEGKKHPQLKLILELKPLYTKKVEDKAVKNALKLVKRLNLESQIEFISFSLNICEEFARQSNIPVSYLTGDIKPEELKRKGIDGIDYHYKIMTETKDMIPSAKECNFITNSWTVNDLRVTDTLIKAGIDYITTDYPEEVTLLINRKK